MPRLDSSAAGPMPESWSSLGDCIAPADRMISCPTFTVRSPALSRITTPAARLFVNRIRRTSVSVTMRSEENTSELQSLMRISYAVVGLKKKKYQVFLHLTQQYI